MLTWIQRHRLRNFLTASIWFGPAVGMAAALLVCRAVTVADAWLGWDSGFSVESARVVYGALASAFLSFIVFVFSMLLVAAQLASAQLTPRIIATAFQDSATKAALSTFVFSFVLLLGLLLRVEDRVPQLTTGVVMLSSVASLVAYLFMIDHVISHLRPVRQLASVAHTGRRIVEAVYPQRLGPMDQAEAEESPPVPKIPFTEVLQKSDGVLLAFDFKGLLELARKHAIAIELVPRVGDFVSRESTLFRVYGGTRVPEGALRRSVAFGAERTMEQDPLFAFRIVVDVACKALSPAVNDPTTAVLALDQLHHMLRAVGRRRLDSGLVRDAEGALRLVYRTPDWKDFVGLAVTEIRLYGKDSIQVARRLRAMLEDLIGVLPPGRTARLARELELLKRSVQRGFLEPEDRELADRGDSQGMGGE